MLDVLTKGGVVVSPTQSERFDVGVKDGRIVLFADPGAVDVSAKRIVDAAGKYVVPGGIDAHVHFNIRLSETMTAQSSKPGGRAGAYGGTTTFIDFAFQAGEGSLVRAIEDKQAELKADAPDIDYALHAMVTGLASLDVIDEVPDAISGGVTSFKMFTTFSGGSAAGGTYADDGRIWGVMKQTARHGGIAMVHCEDDCIIDHCVHELDRAGRAQAPHIHEARPSLCEEAAIMRMLLLAKRSGSPLYIVHVSSIEGIEAIAEARGKSQPVYGEALHNYLAYCDEDYERPNGMIYHNYPALKSAKDRAALWEAVRTGVLDVASSDDFTVPFAKKVAGTRVDNATGGHNGIETRMAYLFSEGVRTKRLGLNRYVDVTATAPAKLFGLYPRKGIIAIGSDADIVVMDPNASQTVRLADLHSDCDYSIWDGWTFEGLPVMTMLRGEILVENGVWTGPEGRGRFVESRAPQTPN